MEAEVFKKNDWALGWVSTGSLYISSNTILQESDFPVLNNNY
jgi:hypothetical protein